MVGWVVLEVFDEYTRTTSISYILFVSNVLICSIYIYTHNDISCYMTPLGPKRPNI
jgi:hypothetical protein